MKSNAQKKTVAGKRNDSPIRIYKPGEEIIRKDIAKKQSFCGYCGTIVEGEPVVPVKCGALQDFYASEKVALELMTAKNSEKMFWIKVCPACGFAVGVIQ